MGCVNCVRLFKTSWRNRYFALKVVNLGSDVNGVNFGTKMSDFKFVEFRFDGKEV